MRKVFYYCDVCGKEIGNTNKDEGALVKRAMARFVGSERLEVQTVVRGWSGPIDICETCAKAAVIEVQEDEVAR